MSDDDDGGIGIDTVRRVVESMVPSIVRNIVPSWVWQLGSISIVVGGSRFYLVDEPIAFVRAIFADGLISGVQLIVGTFAAQILGLLDGVASIGSDVGRALLDSTGAVGDSVIVVIDVATTTLETIVVAAGPASPLVVAIVYGGSIVVVAGAVRGLLIIAGWAP